MLLLLVSPIWHSLHKALPMATDKGAQKTHPVAKRRQGEDDLSLLLTEQREAGNWLVHRLTGGFLRLPNAAHPSTQGE